MFPENLFTHPSLRNLRPTEQPLSGSVSDRRLSGTELFEAWRNQAAVKGFGPEQVDAMFAAGQRLGKVVRWERNNLGAEGVEAAYHAVVRSNSRVSMVTAKRDCRWR